MASKDVIPHLLKKIEESSVQPAKEITLKFRSGIDATQDIRSWCVKTINFLETWVQNLDTKMQRNDKSHGSSTFKKNQQHSSPNLNFRDPSIQTFEAMPKSQMPIQITQMHDTTQSTVSKKSNTKNSVTASPLGQNTFQSTVRTDPTQNEQSTFARQQTNRDQSNMKVEVQDDPSEETKEEMQVIADVSGETVMFDGIRQKLIDVVHQNMDEIQVERDNLVVELQDLTGKMQNALLVPTHIGKYQEVTRKLVFQAQEDRYFVKEMGRVFTDGLLLANKVKIKYGQMFGPVNVKNTNVSHWPTEGEIEIINRSDLDNIKINRVDIGLVGDGSVISACKFVNSALAASHVFGKWPPNPNEVSALPTSTTPAEINVRAISLTWNAESIIGIEFKDEKDTAISGSKGSSQVDDSGLGQTLIELNPNQHIIGVSIKVSSAKVLCGLAFHMAEQ